jgi:phosphonatase-like hydrolase
MVRLMAARLQLFVFDLAGTTVVDDGHVMHSFAAAAASQGLVAAPELLRARMGWHKQLVFATLLREQGRDAALAPILAARFEEEFALAVRRAPLRPTPGAVEAIRMLLAAGLRVAFNTGFSRSTADVVLAAMDWQRHPSVASDEVANGRPAPDLIRRAMALTDVTDPARVGVAGDTPSDLLAGTAAGCGVVVGVGCGSHRLAELAGHPHTALLPDLTALAELVLVHG